MTSHSCSAYITIFDRGWKKLWSITEDVYTILDRIWLTIWTICAFRVLNPCQWSLAKQSNVKSWKVMPKKCLIELNYLTPLCERDFHGHNFFYELEVFYWKGPWLNLRLHEYLKHLLYNKWTYTICIRVQNVHIIKKKPVPQWKTILAYNNFNTIASINNRKAGQFLLSIGNPEARGWIAGFLPELDGL